MSTSDFRKRTQSLLGRLSEYNADFCDILSQLEEIRVLALQGLEQEKLTHQGEVVILEEKYLAEAHRAIAGKLQTVKEAYRIAEADEAPDESEYIIHIQSLEESLGSIVP